MKFKKLKWVVFLITLFSVMGVAYGGWTQQINVNSTLQSALFNGDVYHTSHDDSVVTKEVDFNNTYDVTLNRIRMFEEIQNIEVSDCIVVNNSSSIPSKYYVNKSRAFESQLIVSYVVEDIVVIEPPTVEKKETAETTELSDEQTTSKEEAIKPEVTLVSSDFTESVALSESEWLFSYEVDGKKVSNLSYNALIDGLNSILSDGIDVNSSKEIYITEKFVGDLTTYINLEGKTIKDLEYTFIWSYDYDVEQVPINQ